LLSLYTYYIFPAIYAMINGLPLVVKSATRLHPRYRHKTRVADFYKIPRMMMHSMSFTHDGCLKNAINDYTSCGLHAWRISKIYH